MERFNELTEAVSVKAKQYVEETGEKIDRFPASIVDFVVEYVIANCHFPSRFKEKDIVAILEPRKSTLAMACVDVYAKAGAEGQTFHLENSVSRTYKDAWITPDLLSNFPNYVTIL